MARRGIIVAPYGGSAASIPWRGFGRRIFATPAT
jgi:hypothetical protein